MKFEIESNFENRLNLRGLKMKMKRPRRKFPYAELPEKIQKIAIESWYDKFHRIQYLLYWEEFCKTLEQKGLVLKYGDFNIWKAEVDVDPYSTLGTSQFIKDITGKSALKKVMAFYDSLRLATKTYRLNKGQYVSKVFMKNWYWKNAHEQAFMSCLKEQIQNKNLELTLYDYFQAAIKQSAQALIDDTQKLISNSSEEIEKELFFRDGSCALDFWGNDL